MVRLPVHVHELMSKVMRCEAEFEAAHSVAPTREQLAKLAGIPKEKLTLLSKARRPSSLLPSHHVHLPAWCAAAAAIGSFAWRQIVGMPEVQLSSPCSICVLSSCYTDEVPW